MKKPYLIFLGVALVMTLLLYFYPADLFEAETTFTDGALTKDVTLKQIISQSTWEDSKETIQNQIVTPTLKGWTMLFICLIGLPGLIAWRSTMTK